jgi:hypothetical protein
MVNVRGVACLLRGTADLEDAAVERVAPRRVAT